LCTLSKAEDFLVWEPVSNVPGEGRHHPITFANETHAFFLSGTTFSQPYSKDFYMYDEKADEWTDLSLSAPFPGKPRSFGYGVVLPELDNTKAYLGFGAAENNERLADWWEFDMQTHAWRQLTGFPGPGRRHPAMNVVAVDDSGGGWEIHVGLGDGQSGNFNDWWSYTVATDSWRQEMDFPASRRHHPFYFGLGGISYAGLGHSDGFLPYIERDWYRFEKQTWVREEDFASFDEEKALVTTEARVAGTQFSIELSDRSLGFVLSGDGDDHGTMERGEFHVFDPIVGSWRQLVPHPGASRWAPGSFVIRGTSRAYFTSGYDRSTGILHNDAWKIDLTSLFTSTNIDTDETPSSTAPDGNNGLTSSARGLSKEPICAFAVLTSLFCAIFL